LAVRPVIKVKEEVIMQNYQVLQFRKQRDAMYKDMTINQLQAAKNQWLERLDSGMRIDQTALNQINAELKKRGEL